MEKLISQMSQINKMHTTSQIWIDTYDNFDALTAIKNSPLYTLLYNFTINPTSEIAQKINNIWQDDIYDSYKGSCYFKANVNDNKWSLAILSNNRYWDPYIVKYTSETGLQLDNDIDALKSKLDKLTEELTQLIGEFNK